MGVHILVLPRCYESSPARVCRAQHGLWQQASHPDLALLACVPCLDGLEQDGLGPRRSVISLDKGQQREESLFISSLRLT